MLREDEVPPSASKSSASAAVPEDEVGLIDPARSNRRNGGQRNGGRKGVGGGKKSISPKN